MKQLNIWINKFHNTKAKSTLSEQDILDINYKLHDGYINKSHKDYRKLNRLESLLCPHNNNDCSCITFNQINNS